jgi:hypothetical protein
MATSVYDDQAYQEKLRQQLQQQSAPSLAENKFNYDQGIASLDLNQSQAAQSYDEQLQALTRTAQETPHNILNQFQHLGTRSSGLAGETLATGMQQDQKKIGSAQQQRAIQLGQLALQRANLVANQTFGAQHIQQGVDSSFNDLMGQEQNRRREEEKYQQQLALQQQSARAASSRSSAPRQLTAAQQMAQSKQQFLQGAAKQLNPSGLSNMNKAMQLDPNGPLGGMSYQNVLSEYAKQFPGAVNEFIDAYPPEQYLFDTKKAQAIRSQASNWKPSASSSSLLGDGSDL